MHTDKIKSKKTRKTLPRRVRNERGEGRGEGRLIKTASSPQPSPPIGEAREKITQSPGFPMFSKSLFICVHPWLKSF
jgi:hypothetical protein